MAHKQDVKLSNCSKLDMFCNALLC